MLILQTTLISTILGLFWFILVKKGAILQEISQWANLDSTNRRLGTLLTCPYCMAGQFALALSIISIFHHGDWSVLISIPCASNLTFLIFNEFYKNNN